VLISCACRFLRLGSLAVSIRSIIMTPSEVLTVFENYHDKSEVGNIIYEYSCEESVTLRRHPG
jgi:hypothetical protein